MVIIINYHHIAWQLCTASDEVFYIMAVIIRRENPFQRPFLNR